MNSNISAQKVQSEYSKGKQFKENLNLFEQVKNDCCSEIMSLYETKCCGRKNYISKVLFDPAEGKEGYFHPSPNREIREGKNVKLLRKCPICGKRAKPFEAIDAEQ